MKITELTEQQVEKLAAKMPLPQLSEEHEMFIVQEFVKSRAKTISCVLLGKSDLSLKREMREYIKSRRQSLRWDQFCERNACKWDAHRGKYLALLPE